VSLHRIPPILQSVAQARNWVVENVPAADSMLGYDLFLKLGNDLVAGQALALKALVDGLPYPEDEVVRQLQRLEQAGLLMLATDADQGLVLRPTSRFLDLLDHYSRMFERLFIVRQELRGQQLLVQTGDATLGELVRALYDRVYDLGWLYLHNFGGACFLMASLMHRLVELHGRRARIASCYVKVQKDDSIYRLGAQGYAKPGQVDGHAVCIVDEAVIVDFGLGNVRKGYRRDFHWGVACDYRRDGALMGGLQLPTGETMTWLDDWQSPATQDELARYAPHLDGLVEQYLARFR
jgi:hypothetical protein